MSVESAADRAAFFDPGEFGSTATITPVAGEPIEVDGLYTADHLGIGMGAEAGISSAAPMFQCRSADLAGVVAPDDTLEVAGIGYRIVDVQPDESGMTRITLTE